MKMKATWISIVGNVLLALGLVLLVAILNPPKWYHQTGLFLLLFFGIHFMIIGHQSGKAKTKTGNALQEVPQPDSK